MPCRSGLYNVIDNKMIGGSMLCGLAETSGVFIMARVLSGTGAAGILHGAMRILAFALPGAQRIYMEGMGAVMMGTSIQYGPYFIRK